MTRMGADSLPIHLCYLSHLRYRWQPDRSSLLCDLCGLCALGGYSGSVFGSGLLVYGVCGRESPDYPEQAEDFGRFADG